MPVYEYKCNACSKEFEELQSIKDPVIDTCPSCGQKDVKRLISSGGGFMLRGDGWANTGYTKMGPSTPVGSASGGRGSTGPGN